MHEKITLALETLLNQTIKQRATVVTESEPLVIVDKKAMRHIQTESLPNGRLGFKKK